MGLHLFRVIVFEFVTCAGFSATGEYTVNDVRVVILTVGIQSYLVLFMRQSFFFIYIASFCVLCALTHSPFHRLRHFESAHGPADWQWHLHHQKRRKPAESLSRLNVRALTTTITHLHCAPRNSLFDVCRHVTDLFRIGLALFSSAASKYVFEWR